MGNIFKVVKKILVKVGSFLVPHSSLGFLEISTVPRKDDNEIQ